jgi:hypothetical protein
MGGNYMDPRRRPAVLETALRTTRALVRAAVGPADATDATDAADALPARTGA